MKSAFAIFAPKCYITAIMNDCENPYAPIRKRPRGSAADRALKLLSMRAHGSAELARKLLRAGFPPDEVDQVIENCRRKGFLDDRQFAADAAREIAAGGGGRRLIQMKLKQRGLGSEEVSAALAETAPDEHENALRIARGKLRLLTGESDPRKKKEKLVRFMAGRGFDFGTISDTLEALRRECDSL